MSASAPAVNQVTLVGNLTADPVLKQLDDDRKVWQLRLAVNDQKDRPMFIDVATFGAQADACAKYLAKGRAVAVTGRLVYREPIAAVLRDYLIEHRLRGAEGLVFGRDGDTPWATGSISQRANKAWKAAKLTPIALHECRHTFASLMIAAGVNPKALQTFMGHSSITVTLDRYGHLFPGSEGEAAVLLDAYLAESHERARGASIDEPGHGESWGSRDPLGAVLNGLERHFQAASQAPAEGETARI
jgi:Single-strand binding protein family/Phage integrase family